MYILGVKFRGHDPSAALLKDGKIIAAAEEERFLRNKHAAGAFPINAIKFCLDHADITINDVDHIAQSWGSTSYRRKKFLWGMKELMPLAKSIGWGQMLRFFAMTYLLGYDEKSLNKNLRKEFGGDYPRVSHVPHSECHMASAYYPSPFKSAKVMCIEGGGDNEATTFSVAKELDMGEISRVLLPNSLGYFYTAFTMHLGFRACDGEGKTMGLAPYGKPEYNLDHVLWKTDNGYKYNYKYGFVNNLGKQTIQEFGQPRHRDGEFTSKHENLAASVQEKLEEVALHVLGKYSEGVDEKNLCLAGGVALNVKMNQVMRESEYVDDIYIQPAANDGGCSLGAALALYYKLGGKERHEMKDVYLGPEFTNEQIKAILDELKLKYEYVDDIAGEAGKLIAQDKIIAWFQGRMEWGPRALGNRSILANPANPEMKDLINYYVKRREAFRPFCPSILHEAIEEYFVDPKPSPFMTLAFTLNEGKGETVPAITHVDNTARPQTVTKEINEKYYNLIKSFESESGIPLILNTSFNIRGEPIALNPYDAIKCFYSNGIDALAIGNYLLQK